MSMDQDRTYYIYIKEKPATVAVLYIAIMYSRLCYNIISRQAKQ